MFDSENDSSCTRATLFSPRPLSGSAFRRISQGTSSVDRHGDLIIATASGVHPGFAGCLTLELTNLGELPIEMRPGMAICQLFLHEATGEPFVDRSSFVGLRRPALGVVTADSVAVALGKSRAW